MNGERTACFVDTNILVYAFEKNDSSKRRTAQRLVNELMESDRLRLSTQILQELFVVLTRKSAQRSTCEEALAVLEDLAVWPVKVVDYYDIRSAAELTGRASLSFWDSLVLVAAERSGASVLYSEDMNDGQEVLGVRITNPFSTIAPS